MFYFLSSTHFCHAIKQSAQNLELFVAHVFEERDSNSHYLKLWRSSNTIPKKKHLKSDHVDHVALCILVEKGTREFVLT